MEKGQKRKKRIVFFLSMLSVLLCSAVFFELIRNISRNRMTDFSEGWTISYKGQEYPDTDLDHFRFYKGVKRGDLISLKNRLPEDIPDGYAIVFPLELSTISVDVNGKIIYGYGSMEYAAGQMVGSAVHLIRLPDGCQGGTVSIVIMVGDDGAFSYIPKIMLDETSWGFEDYLNSNIYPVVVSISLVMAGMVFMIISFFLALRSQDWERINQTGILFFVVGCWNIYEIQAIQLFSMDFSWNTFARYFFSLLSVLPILRILSSAHKNKSAGKIIAQKLIFYSLQIIIAVILALSVSNVIHICNIRYFYDILAILCMIAVAFLEWKDSDRNEFRLSARFREHMACFLFVGIEVVRFLANRIFNFHLQEFQHSFLLYGTVFLVMMMIGSYIYELYESYVRKAEEKSLKQVAYTDGLTGLLNRTFCKDRMEELDRSDKDYHMISFDVDGLKKINDSKGHLAGDKLLTTFADILSQCFSDVGNVIRPGGDEFLVISDDAAKQELLSRLNWLDSLEKNAEKSLGFPVRAAYGIAGRNEVLGHTTEEVYFLADQRMYEMKMKRKDQPA